MPSETAGHFVSSGRRLVLALVITLVGCLQAWDSDVLAASPIVWVLAALGILIPAAAAMVEDPRRAILVSIPISALLLISAKLISARPLPAILLISVAAGGLLYFNARIEAREAEEAASPRR